MRELCNADGFPLNREKQSLIDLLFRIAGGAGGFSGYADGAGAESTRSAYYCA